MKILAIILLVILNVSQGFASFAEGKFAVETIPPECLINGVTINYTGYNQSDTSSWAMPKAYDGNCIEAPELFQSEKEKIYVTIYDFFIDKNYIQSSYGGWVVGLTREYSNQINQKWQDFIMRAYFPFITKYIQTEIQQENPNYKNIAILNYTAYIIGYDYRFQQ